MPWLEIKACTDCPYHHTTIYTEDGSFMCDDGFRIGCDHPDQKSDEMVTTRVKSSYNNIYFDCPLDKKDDEEE